MRNDPTNLEYVFSYISGLQRDIRNIQSGFDGISQDLDLFMSELSHLIDQEAKSNGHTRGGFDRNHDGNIVQSDTGTNR